MKVERYLATDTSYLNKMPGKERKLYILFPQYLNCILFYYLALNCITQWNTTHKPT